MDHTNSIAHALGLRPQDVGATITLLDQGNTLPFIARYRKEATGGLDEEQLLQVSNWLERFRVLEKRKETVLASISRQEKLTPELTQQIKDAEDLNLLEDLYQPYKPKRSTRASKARQYGLQGLADLIIAQPLSGRSDEEHARDYINDQVPSTDTALAGARDIVAEAISDNPQIRQKLRARAMRWSTVSVNKIEKIEDQRSVYQIYYDYQGGVHKLYPHQVLAINRGEREGILRVRLEVPERDWRSEVGSLFRPDQRSSLARQLEEAIEDGAKRLLLPAIERVVRRSLTETAEAHAIDLFAKNLRGLLQQPPLVGFTVLGIDPGFRTGCKVAVVDETGKLLDTETIFLPLIKRNGSGSRETILELIDRFGVNLIAIGNGTASRETEQWVAELIQEESLKCSYLIANEAGASVYSASARARDEFPDLDVSLRGAVSISRRVQDPLAELVKIDPKSIGVGLYQHDVNQTQLSKTLAVVVESVVNQVGVDINTASSSLLTHVAGVGPKTAVNIITYRDNEGAFLSRKDILKVPGMGPKSFEQAAGFLRIRDGHESLDSSAIHPESYPVARAILKNAGTSMDDSYDERKTALQRWRGAEHIDDFARHLGAGVPTTLDILDQLARPGRDPREDLPQPIMRKDILKLEDLKVGMRLKGTVRNVVDFGAFVDIGLKNDGLLHRSQWPSGNRPVVGDIIDVGIILIEADRGRIGLSRLDQH